MNTKKKYIKPLIVLLGLISLAILDACEETPLLTEGTISGIVTNSQFNNEPIAGATVTISGTNEEKVTGSDGRFAFVVESNTNGYTLQYSHPEFQTDENSNVRVEPGGETDADVALDPIVPLELSLIDLDFGSSSSQESFNVTNLRNGELDFTVTTSADFVTASPNTGRIGAQNTSVIRVTIDRSGLTVGELTEQIIINVPNRGSAVVNVLITVLDASAAVLSVDQTTLGYGTETTSRSLEISNTGEKTLEWTASVSDSWITLSDVSGSLNPTEDQSITVNVNRTDLEAGSYTGTVNFAGNGGAAAISLSMEVVAGNAQPVLEVSETNFNFGLETNSFDVSINNTGNADLEWTATSSDSWLTLSRSSGSVSPTGSQGLTLNVSRAALNEGNFTATVTISSNGGEATLNVSMDVPSQSPVLTLSTTFLAFGETDDLRSVTIENTGLQDLNWSAATDESWLSISSSSGTVSSASSSDINVNIDRTGLADGDYSGKVSFTSDGGDATLDVAMTVVGNGAGNDADNDGIPDAVDADDDGDGLIEIFTINDLNNIRNDLSADGSTLSGGPITGFTGYELTQDLDFENDDHYSDISLKSEVTTGFGWKPIGLDDGNFDATLEGNGFTISNLLINRTTNYTALIAATTEFAEVQNLTVEIKFLSGSQYSAGLIGWNNGDVSNCVVTGDITTSSHYCGLLIGVHPKGTIENSYATGIINASDADNVGGLIGLLGSTNFTSGEIVLRQSYANVTVIGRQWVGGLFGILTGRFSGTATISSCYARGTVQGEPYSSFGSGIGGITSFLGGAGKIDNCYSLAEVTAEGTISTFYSGSFLGNNSGDISNSFAAGPFTTNSSAGYFGGFSGANNGSISSSNYWDTEVTGQSTSTGDALGQTTTQLQALTTNAGIYATWSTEVWDFGSASQYPALKNMPGGLNAQRD
ncbi:MAG: carboxypeptidase regulatory-like domain-containing protein [Cytophagales bacterium]|nr:carboxypeptidase regulatory-like domain-containing protein [Cytophagales bacterium]